jgi:hemerythrin-like domain-containing protein
MTGFVDFATAELSFAEHEHRELTAGIADIEDVADRAGWASGEDFAGDLRRVRHWYRVTLRPHTSWEEYVLYPAIDERTGTEWATRLMRFEHQQIARLAGLVERDLDGLAGLDGAMAHEGQRAARAHLYSLAALLRAHMEREDTFLLPVLGN